jgi:hypothetical protein
MRQPNDIGTAMTEAAISLPVLLLLFMATYYFHGLYRAKLRSMRAAATEAWGRVNKDDCRNDPMSTERTMGDDVEQLGNASQVTPSNARSWIFNFSRIRMESRPFEHAVPRILNNTSGKVEVQSEFELTCNEKLHDDALDFLGSLFGSVIGQF